jgi:hypothetical protein
MDSSNSATVPFLRPRLLFWGLGLALAGCAHAGQPVMIEGRPVARVRLGYTDHRYFVVNHVDAFPRPRGPSSGLTADDGRIIGTVCGTEITLESRYRHRYLSLSGFVQNAHEAEGGMTRGMVDYQPKYQQAYGVNPTYLAFVARATVETLREYPWINGEIRGEQIVTRNYVNLGFAVELKDGKGLIVPVLKHAEGLNLLGIARGVTEIAERARNKQLSPDDVQGGTFTITNPGGYGTFHGTPVISQPQAAILGTYAVVKRPWVIQDDHGQDVIAIRPIMNLTLTYDHRVVDGALAGRFLRDLREKLQTWDESAY